METISYLVRANGINIVYKQTLASARTVVTQYRENGCTDVQIIFTVVLGSYQVEQQIYPKPRTIDCIY